MFLNFAKVIFIYLKETYPNNNDIFPFQKLRTWTEKKKKNNYCIRKKSKKEFHKDLSRVNKYLGKITIILDYNHFGALWNQKGCWE